MTEEAAPPGAPTALDRAIRVGAWLVWPLLAAWALDLVPAWLPQLVGGAGMVAVVARQRRRLGLPLVDAWLVLLGLALFAAAVLLHCRTH